MPLFEAWSNESNFVYNSMPLGSNNGLIKYIMHMKDDQSVLHYMKLGKYFGRERWEGAQ